MNADRRERIAAARRGRASPDQSDAASCHRTYFPAGAFFLNSSATCLPTFDIASSAVSSALYFRSSSVPGIFIKLACDMIDTAAPMPGFTRPDMPPPMPAPNDEYELIMFIIGLPPIIPIVITPMYMEPAKVATRSADESPKPPLLDAFADADMRGLA